jgi:hypothetical protein
VKRSLSILAGVIAVMMAVVVSAGIAMPASAAPAGAATNLSFGSQTCQANGTISGMLRWTPSGLGSQYVDLAVDAGFKNFSTGGPYAASANAVQFVQLKPGMTYYTRMRTVVGGGTLTSDVLTIVADCSATGNITPPHHLRATALNDGRVRFDWTPGQNNIWYCLDTATDLQALYGGYGSWSNHGCWNTQNTLTVSNLACGTTYYWLLYTWNFTDHVKSAPALVRTVACAAPQITAPTNLNTTLTNDGGVLFDWVPGQNNVWFCVDTAKNVADLYNLDGTWSNHGCGTTQSEFTVYNLDCSEDYVWLVFAANATTWAKSAPATVHTQACKSETVLAPIVSVDVSKAGSSYVADIEAALPNGCHEPDSHRVQRFGNTIEITVWNKVAPGPCTLIYGEYELHVNLGSNFVDGQTYKVVVNDEMTETFVAD